MHVNQRNRYVHRQKGRKDAFMVVLFLERQLLRGDCNAGGSLGYSHLGGWIELKPPSVLTSVCKAGGSRRAAGHAVIRPW